MPNFFDEDPARARFEALEQAKGFGDGSGSVRKHEVLSRLQAAPTRPSMPIIPAKKMASEAASGPYGGLSSEQLAAAIDKQTHIVDGMVPATFRQAREAQFALSQLLTEQGRRQTQAMPSAHTTLWRP